jgi:hypothetical protein
MTTSLTTIDTNNFAAMAKAMGIAADTENAKKSSSTLARLRLQHTPILGDDKILVKAGQYKLEIPDGPTYYAQSVNLRPYLQRFMYKRFIKGHGDKPNRYVKTVMADNLNIDLKDNDGGFNCGKPAGYIQDFKALPEKTQNLIKEIKRVRVMLGTVELIKPTDAKGNSVELDETAFIWEIENRDAFKDVGSVFAKLGKMKRLPIQHMVSGNTQERKLPNGNSFYLPVMSLDVTKTLDLGDKEQETFADFMSWVENYNTYIINTWSEKASNYDDELDAEIASDIIDIDFDEEVA